MKYDNMQKCIKVEESLPAGERGLKYDNMQKCIKVEESLPAGERGLKYTDDKPNLDIILVAPRWGAGIEIVVCSSAAALAISRSPLGSGD